MLADPAPPRGPRDLSTVLLRRGRLSLVLEPRDLWIGLYVAPGAVWVILVPCLPLRWERRPGGTAGSGTAPDADDAGYLREWMPGQWG